MTDVVVELHLPLVQDALSSAEAGSWIDDVSALLQDEEAKGQLDAQGGDGEEIGQAYVFWLRGDNERTLLVVASEAARLGGVPAGAVALVQGRRVDLPVPGAFSLVSSPSDWWLEGGVDGDDRFAGLRQEVDRLIEVLTVDEQWLAWWHATSTAPALEVHLLVTRRPRATEHTAWPEVVRRGRHRHYVRMHVDQGPLLELERDEQRLHALPLVLDAVCRARVALRLSEPPPVPAAAQPAPLSQATLRRRRLQQLLADRTS